MRVTTALLLYTVYFTHSASAAGSSDRRGIVGRRSQPFYPSSNDTLSSSFSSTVPPSAPAPADAAALSSSSFSSASSHSSIGFNSSSLAMSRLPSLSSSSSPLHSTPSPPSRASSTNSISPASTQPSATITITTSHTPLYGPAVPIQSECPPNVDASGCTTAPTDDDGATIDYTAGVPTSNGDCMSIDDPDKPMTQFSVVYTSTVTFYGNRSEYIPPFEPLVTPTYCTPALGPAFPFSSGLDEMPPSDIPMGPISVEASGRHANLPVITFITTDKNPSVVVPSDPVPRYSPTSIPGGRGGEDYGSGNHKTAADVGDPGGGSHLIPDAESVSNGPRSSFVITARADDVVINEQTYSDLGPSQTTAVTVSGATFTISPTAVVGEGTVIEKPAPVGAIVSMAMPTSGKVGGLPVTLTGSEAIVGGTTFSIAEGGTTAVVDGRRVSIGPGTLVVGKDILSFPPALAARETDMLVDGGELLTAVGRSVVVVHSTTFTYGPGIPGVTEMVNGDTISIGPSGVLVHGMVMGGPLADVTRTSFEIVGGATIARIAPSNVVINGVTFTVGPGTQWTTTVIAGKTFTIGPTGVVVSSLTLKYPFGSAITTTVVARDGTSLHDVPIETAGETNVEDKGTSLRPDVHVGWMAVCIATGVLILV